MAPLCGGEEDVEGKWGTPATTATTTTHKRCKTAFGVLCRENECSLIWHSATTPPPTAAAAATGSNKLFGQDRWGLAHMDSKGQNCIPFV